MITGEPGKLFSAIFKSRLFSIMVVSEVDEKEKREDMIRRDAFLVIYFCS